jgi:hypothetical protein
MAVELRFTTGVDADPYVEDRIDLDGLASWIDGGLAVSD